VNNSGHERLAYIDFLRGVAVLGLLLLNAPFMGLIEFGYAPTEPVAQSDYVVATINSLFLDGRFRSLFCLLFGIGIYLQYSSYARKGYIPKNILMSRLQWLLAFGIAHCTFIWTGDILILYALSGFFLLKRMEWSAEQQFKKGLMFFAIGMLITFAEVGAMVLWDESMVRGSDSFNDAYASLSQPYYETVITGLFMAVVYVISFPLLSLFYLCGVMLIGIGLFRLGKLQTGFDKYELKVLWLVTILFSLFSVFSLFYDFGFWQFFTLAFSSISGLSMALLIWHFVITSELYSNNGWLVSSIRKVGTMALSFYILQSLVFTTLLRYLMPELILNSSLYIYSLMALAFVVVQLVLASVYKQCFNQGPLEYIWRRLANRERILAHKAESSL